MRESHAKCVRPRRSAIQKYLHRSIASQINTYQDSLLLFLSKLERICFPSGQLSSDDIHDNLEPRLVPLTNAGPPSQVCSMIDRKN